MPSLRQKIIDLCGYTDAFITVSGKIFAWLNCILILVIIIQVVLRYVFGKGMVSLEELQWHIYAVCFMFGISYNISQDAHVRLDLFHRNFSQKTRDIIEITGLLLLLLPMAVVIFLHSIDFVAMSYRLGERSSSPLGLPFRWLIKSVIPISMIMVIVVTISKRLRLAVGLTQ